MFRSRLFHTFSAALVLGSMLTLAACKGETKEQQFKRSLEEFSQKECPKFVDQYTKLDSADYSIEERTLSYHYTIVGELDCDSIYNEENNAQIYSDILDGLKHSIQLKPYKDESINFRYTYHSASTGKMLLELVYTPNDYNQ